MCLWTENPPENFIRGKQIAGIFASSTIRSHKFFTRLYFGWRELYTLAYATNSLKIQLTCSPFFKLIFQQRPHLHFSDLFCVTIAYELELVAGAFNNLMHLASSTLQLDDRIKHWSFIQTPSTKYCTSIFAISRRGLDIKFSSI